MDSPKKRILEEKFNGDFCFSLIEELEEEKEETTAKKM